MSIHNIGFYEDLPKLSFNYHSNMHLISSSAYIFTSAMHPPSLISPNSEPHSGRSVLSLGKTYLPTKNTGNTQEAVAPSQHD